MCEPRVTRHTSLLYSIPCHTRVNTGASIFFTAAMIRGSRSSRSCRRFICVLCTKCTLHSIHTHLLVWYSNTQNDFSPGAAIFSHIHSHRLAAEMWTTMKNNLLGKNVLSCSFYLYRFRKYVFYSFPIINFCNPGVHYKMPCIFTNQTCSLITLYGYRNYQLRFWSNAFLINDATTLPRCSVQSGKAQGSSRLSRSLI